jgi:hypothetical protein
LGNPIVAPIAQKRWNDERKRGDRPGPRQMASGTQHGSRFEEGSSGFDKYDSVEVIKRHSTPIQKHLTGVRLEGGQPQSPFFVMADNELDKTIAEIANTVEKDHRITAFDVGWPNALGCGHDRRLIAINARAR